MIMKYKGYIGKVEYDSDHKTFYGSVIGLNDIITFVGKTAAELEQALKDSVEDYLEMCREGGKKPEKSFSGNIRLRLEPTLHAEVSHKASMMGVSLNTYIAEKLRDS